MKEIGDVDTLALNDIIKSKIIEAVKRVHSSAPPYLLDGGHNFGDEVYWQKCESGWVLLPEDFMRFVVFQMSDEQSEEDKQLPFGGEVETHTQQAAAPIQHASTANANSDIPAILQGMDKKTLIAVIEKLELPVEFRPTTPPSKLRELITESICSVYELEVSDEEGISAIIDGAFDEEGAQEESQQEEPATEAQNPVTVKAPVTSGSGAKAKSSLLEKYKNQK